MDARDIESIEQELQRRCAMYYDDPVSWAYWAFDWGHGELAGIDGLDPWQEEELRALGEAIKDRAFNGVDPVVPIRSAVSSGHGIGKSALVAILILFIMSTRPHAKGTVTANTGDQLRTKTWGELAKWKNRCIVGHWFELNSGKGSLSLYHPAYNETWRVDAVTCREENSEAFAGQHNMNSTSFYIFDEASAVPDVIWEVAEGGLTDGEPMFFAFGNPTRNTGEFKKKFSDSRWRTKQVDSRTVRWTNKALLNEWAEVHGEDSDFFRVRVRGVFPRASDLQYFPTDVVSAARKRPVPLGLRGEPLVCGLDYARGGSDKCVIQFRRGRDARTFDRYEIPAEKSRDSMKVAAMIATVLDRHRPDICFGDVGSMGGPINDRLRQLGYNVVDVGFGHRAEEDSKFADRTSEMSSRLLEWMQSGGALPDVEELEEDLTNREFTFDSKDRLLMESKRHMKQRIGRSPDDMDAMLLTFASKTAVNLLKLNAEDEDDLFPYAGEPAKVRRYEPF